MTNGPRWHEVDAYIERTLLGNDGVLQAALRDADAAGLPPISVSAPQGKMLEILARGCGARRVLEIGTLAGYSAICLGRALPENGRLISLELEPRHAEVARANLRRAGLAGRVEVRVGAGLETIAAMRRDGEEPFDLVFIDADKPGYPAYLEAVRPLLHVGSLIVADNVVRNGAVASNVADEAVQGVRRFNEMLAADPAIDATVVQTVGVKGYDGFALAIVR